MLERGVIKRDVVIKPAGGKYLVRYTPVTSDAAAKLVISLAALRCWKREQWDIVDAYLNAAIDNGAIFMKQPTGHEFFWPWRRRICMHSQSESGTLWPFVARSVF